MPAGLVSDPHYGDSLFYFYQSRYFSAVTQLMVSQHFERMPHHADEAEVLRGGLFLSYGLHREAGEVFEKLIERGAPPPVRDRAWFYLAKIRYQRGLVGAALDAIGRIEGKLPADLEEDRLLLHANLLMARADYDGAAGLLEQAAPKGKPTADGAGAYVYFNLGVALLQGGDRKRGFQFLDKVGQAPAAAEEFRSLRDRANLALGFASLQAAEGETAHRYLERVRLKGMHATRALLGFGWASAARGDLKGALVPWTELAAREPRDAAVLEAKLALPYAFAEMGSYGRSLALYQDAVETYERERIRLDESIASIRAGALVDGLMARNAGAGDGEEMGWFWNIDSLPDLPHGAHLAPILAQHAFQEAFKNYRDLHFLARNLERWRENLAVLRDMQALRRKTFDERLPQIQEQQRALDLDTLRRRRDELFAELSRVESEVDGEALADGKERALLARLRDARAVVEAAGDDPDMSDARDRLRRVAGALLWNLSQTFPQRLWQAQKAARGVDDGLADAARRMQSLVRAQQEEPAKLDAYAGRIDALERRLLSLAPRVVDLIAAQRTQLQELAVAELARQQDRVAAHTTQARFAIAQLYDRAGSAGQEGDRAARP
jgi:tetratricopeptide (TPR) repeat protein